jgi:DNA-binding transcriptional ArsR family regulator
MRVRILDQLREGEQSVGGLAEVLDTSQQNVSKHLQALYGGGAVSRRKDGNTVYYGIADESLMAMCEAVCEGVEQRISELSQIVTRV